MIDVHVECDDSKGGILGAGDGSAPIDVGGRTDVEIVIGHQVDAGIEAGVDLSIVDAAVDGPIDLAADASTPPNVPRLIAPLSGATVSLKKPTLQWVVPGASTSVQVDLCVDRACSASAGTVAVGPGSSAAMPVSDLPGGPVFWRVSATRGGQTKTSAVWEFFVKAKSTSAVADTSFGCVPDFNGDGYADVALSASNATVGTTMGVGRVYVLESAGTSGVPATLPTAIDGRDQKNSFFGNALAATDVNGDGFPDLIVGVPISNTTAPGKIYVFYGSASGLNTSSPTAIIDPSGASGAFGYAVSAAGDVDGDGFGDVVIGADSATVSSSQLVGRVYVFYGSATGLQTAAGTFTAIDGNPADGSSPQFGYAVAGGGDVNGDGFSDIVVGEVGAGKAFVYIGSGSRIANNATPYKSWSSIDGATNGFGAAVSIAEDVNGDGYADVAVSNPGLTVNTNVTQGRVYIFLGSSTGFNASTASVDSSYGAHGSFGYSLSAGDVNGDGYSDLVVGAAQAAHSGNSAVGAVDVFAGSNVGVTATPTTPSPFGFGSPAWFGWSVAAVGDINGDGYADVVIGSEGLSSFAGQAYVYGGSMSGLTSTYVQTWAGVDPNGYLGACVY